MLLKAVDYNVPACVSQWTCGTNRKAEASSL